MTARYLLDTSIVSSPIAKAPNAEVVKHLELYGHESTIAAPVWHELVYGCQRLPRGKRREALEAYIEAVVRASFPILPYDAAAAQWHANERARLDGLGRPTPYVDGQIAAIAVVNGLILVTVNVKDFASFRDIAVENWSKRRS